MKHLIWLLFLFTLLCFDFKTLSAQNTSSALLVSKGAKVHQELASLPMVSPVYINTKATLPIPMYKLPESFDKKYIIRVYQSDLANFKKINTDLPFRLMYHRGFDHTGYDYFLPLPFDKEKYANNYLSQLSVPAFSQAVVVKKVPKNVKCNCSSRF